MANPLQVLEAMYLGDQGQLLEGDIFETLRTSPYILRAWEFALADGAIDVTRAWPTTGMNYADKLWQLFSYGAPGPSQSDLVLFEAKSSSSVDDKGHRCFVSTIAQRRCVAFYLCVSASDTRWVDLIPNYQQDPTALECDQEAWDRERESGHEDERKHPKINVWRDSRLPDTAHGSLDGCTTPYRMPVLMLTEAISRVRSCATDGGEFVNPWTGVTYRGWHPLATRCVSFLKPAESNPQFTAFEEAWSVFTAARERGTMTFDMVGLQPMLADFKLITTTTDGKLRQSMVQAKSEGKERGANNELYKVTVVRQGRYFFDARDRHDFFYFTFEFTGNPPSRVAYFFPQSAAPDRFYTSLEKHQDFTIAALEQYRIAIDDGMEWVDKIERTIAACPSPYRDRQHLRMRLHQVEDETEVAVNPPPSKKRRREARDHDGQTQAKKARSANPQAHTRGSGRQEHCQAVQHGHRRFFYSFMAECATRGQGLLLELARDSLDGDFGYCKYRWSESEKLAFWEFSRVPAFTHTLSPLTPVVFLHYYCRHRECWYTGPKLTDSQFRHLDSSSRSRFVISDISGPDTGYAGDINDRPAIAIVPSDDLQPTLAQRDRLHANLLAKKLSPTEWEKQTPAISNFLSKGKFLSQYCLPTLPLTGGCDWRAVWEFLDRLATCETRHFQHPPGITREAAPFRYTLQQYNQQLADHLKAVLEGRDAKEVLGDSDIEDEA